MASPRRTLDTLKPFQGRDLQLQYALRQGYFEAVAGLKGREGMVGQFRTVQKAGSICVSFEKQVHKQG